MKTQLKRECNFHENTYLETNSSNVASQMLLVFQYVIRKEVEKRFKNILQQVKLSFERNMKTL